MSPARALIVRPVAVVGGAALLTALVCGGPALYLSSLPATSLATEWLILGLWCAVAVGEMLAAAIILWLPLRRLHLQRRAIRHRRRHQRVVIRSVDILARFPPGDAPRAARASRPIFPRAFPVLLLLALNTLVCFDLQEWPDPYSPQPYVQSWRSVALQAECLFVLQLGLGYIATLFLADCWRHRRGPRLPRSHFGTAHHHH